MAKLHIFLNQRGPKLYWFRDQWVTVTHAAALMGMCRNAARARIVGQTIEDTPHHHRGHRITRRYLFRGQRRTVREIATMLGCHPSTVRGRIVGDRVFEAHEAKAIPVERKATERLLRFKGTTRNVTEWAAITGIDRDRIFARLNAGWTIERALTEPVAYRRRRVLAHNAAAVARMAAAFRPASSLPPGGVRDFRHPLRDRRGKARS